MPGLAVTSWTNSLHHDSGIGKPFFVKRTGVAAPDLNDHFFFLSDFTIIQLIVAGMVEAAAGVAVLQGTPTEFPRVQESSGS
jgi:hypothetical protein